MKAGRACSWFFLTFWPWSSSCCTADRRAGVEPRRADQTRLAAGWLGGIIWLTPVLGTILYFTFGINRIQRKARLLRSGRRWPWRAEQRLLNRELLRHPRDDTLH